MRSIGSQKNAIKMHEKRKGDQAMWLNSVCGTGVPWLEPEGRRTCALQDVRQEASGEWTIQCQCEDSGLRALEENTVSDVKATRQHTGQKIHDNEVTGQSAEWAGDVHTNCVRSITTSKSADPVVNRSTADEVTGSDPVINTLSRQMGFMLVVSLTDQAQERVRNSPE